MGLEHAEPSGSFLKDIMHSGGGLGCSSKATIGEDAFAPRDDMPRPTLSSEGGLMPQTSRGTGTGRDARFWRRGVGVGESESGVKSSRAATSMEGTGLRLMRCTPWVLDMGGVTAALVIVGDVGGMW